ncbi:glycosyltransferase family 4 protein [bacterium]|nr:glycosyltransferase family 4 protein [bacterium]
MLKILFDATMLQIGFEKTSARSGLYFVAFNVLKELTKTQNVTLSCTEKDKEIIEKVVKKYLPDFDFEFFVWDKKNPIVKSYENYKFRRTKARDNKKYFKKFIYQILSGFLSPFVKLIQKNKYKNFDVYFSPVHCIPQEVENASNLDRYLILYDLIPVLFPEFYPHHDKNSWHARLLNSLNSKDYYFPISECTKRDFLTHFSIINPDHVNSILLASDEHFKPQTLERIREVKGKYNIPENAKYVFSLCTLEPRKNLIRAVKTFIHFLQKNNIEDLYFVLGGGSWENFLFELEKEFSNFDNYKDKILRAGYVEDEDLPALYSGAEWFVYTSMYEGFGLPPLEAMSCACPVVVSNSSSLPEVVEDTAVMVDWNSDEQHVEAYEKYYFNSKLREENRKRGFERSKEFSWGKTVKNIVDIMYKNEEKRRKL